MEGACFLKVYGLWDLVVFRLDLALFMHSPLLPIFLHSGFGFQVPASEQRGGRVQGLRLRANNLKGSKDFYLQAKAILWP